jgi:hypothetical protein
MNSEQFVAEMLVTNLRTANESGSPDEVVRALTLINFFLTAGDEMDHKEENLNDEEKENEMIPPLVDDDSDYDSDYDDMPPLVDIHHDMAVVYEDVMYHNVYNDSDDEDIPPVNIHHDMMDVVDSDDDMPPLID